LLGELHGENEIPSLIRSIWPSMWEAGYRHVGAEISPWAANRLEFGSPNLPIFGTWTQSEAAFITSRKNDNVAVLWGCDIEELQPNMVIRELAAANAENKNLQAAVDAVKNGYQRRLAQPLLQLMRTAGHIEDKSVGTASLRDSLVETLEVESDRFAGLSLS